jgi:hypothetical protein
VKAALVSVGQTGQSLSRLETLPGIQDAAPGIPVREVPHHDVA